MKIFNTTDDSSQGIEVFDKGHGHGRGIKASKSFLVTFSYIVEFSGDLVHLGDVIQR